MASRFGAALRGGAPFVLAGAVAALGLAPFLFWPGLLLGFAALFWLLPDTPGARGGAVWAFGLGYFLIGLHWIFEPFLVDAARHAWMAPFAVVLLAGGLALFWGAVGWLSARLGGGSIALAVWLSLAEMTRGVVFTGFPWANPAQAWVDASPLYWGAWIGPNGLTALTLLTVATVVTALQRRRVWWGALAGGLAALLGLFAFMPPSPAPLAGADAPVLRLVQPNAPQRDKWDPNKVQMFFDRHIALSSQGPAPDLILWSETALPMMLNHAEIALEIMADATPGVPYLIGVQRFDEDGRYYNSAALVRDALPVAVYDKHHLVPFGEYMPLAPLAARLGLRGLADRLGGYARGPGPQVLDLGFATAMPLICYEAVFPRDLRGTERPDVMVHLTNDAWFGQFSGPYQHLAQSRMRAVEFGLPMVRVANTGVTAVIDARGRVLDSLPLGVHGAIDAALPPPLPPTLYARMGDWPVFGVLIVLALAMAGSTFRLTARSGARKRV